MQHLRIHKHDIRFVDACLSIGNVFTSTMFGLWQADWFAGFFLLGLLETCYLGAFFCCASVHEENTR